MRRAVVLLGVGLAAVLAVGFAARGNETSSSPLRPTYFQDVKPILDGRCTGCHFRGGIAPFALTGYDSARRNRAAVADAVRRRLMPPWHAEAGHRRYLYDPSLTSEQIARITRWAELGGPRGDPSQPAPSLPSVAPHLSQVDVRMAMRRAYTPRRYASADDYRCFVLPWVPDRRTHVTGFNVRPGRAKQVHHIILFLATPENARTVQAWEAQDARPGYGCYGGPSATGQTQLGFQFLAGWVPGSFGTDFARGTGIRVEPGSRLVLQVHYNLQGVAPKPDRSVVELKLDDTVQKRAVYAPLVDPMWILNPPSFRIPAKRSRIEHTYGLDPRQLFSIFSGDIDFSRGFVIHSVLHHMHRLGNRGRVTLVRRSGEQEVLLGVRRWDFNWQREYHFAEPERFEPGDRLSIRCEHANPTRRTRTWGENSSDEMCIAFLYVSEI
jgi:Copper type II ascorbate-dependent monooxygenase, C-terminal domain